MLKPKVSLEVGKWLDTCRGSPKRIPERDKANQVVILRCKCSTDLELYCTPVK